MKNRLVSIVMPSFNSEKTIAQAISSVLSQTYSNWELIIVDDCSTDDSIGVIKNFISNEPKINLIVNRENSGAGFSRNVAIKFAKGKYIAFLDADDLWYLEKLEKQIKFMQRNDYAFTYTQYQKFDANGDGGVVIPPITVTYKQLLYSNVIGCLTAVYDSDKLGKRYMPLIRKRQDMGLWLEILKDIPKAYCLTENLAKYRIDTGMTQNKFSVLGYQWRFYREVVGLGILKAIFTFVIYAYKGFIKSRV
ncbi:MAG: glycosyltransferase family 2 protein [Endozoicomonadaceae bacterium]|nr:glycosyltransferase family 2 protein [Endozoicomonadaceae bacterium]